MRILTVTQGSDEWIAIRKEHNTASEASAMMGKSKYMTRSALMDQKATGITDAVSPAQQAIFDRGHAAEAAARPIAEEIVGEELFPATALDDDGVLLASFDGITMLEDVIWEHKLINAELRHATAETLDEHYKIQMDQQLLVSGAEKCLFMASNGTKEDCIWFWYTSTPERLDAIKAGWKQFNSDLAEYKPREPAKVVTGAVTQDLPAVSVRVEGSLSVIDNFDRFESALTHFVSEVLIRDPQTDQDFADLEAQVKALKKAEDALESAEAQLLAQVEAVDTAKKRKDMLHKLARDNRLMAEKLVKEQKKTIKLKIAQDGRKAVDEHVAKLNAGLEGATLPQIATDFNEAMKGKRTISTLRDAADNEVARAKIEATETAELIRANLKALAEAGYEFLFADRQQLVTKQPDDLLAVIKSRIADHEAKEKLRLEQERERIRAEERRKAELEASRKVAEEQAEREAQECQRDNEQRAEAEREMPKAGEVLARPAGSESAPEESSAPAQVRASRPSDSQIIEALALHFRVHESKVIGWLLDMDLDAESQKLASGF